MKRTPIFFLLLFLIGMAGCGRKPLLEDTCTFSERSWNRFRMVEFQPELTRENGYYDIIIRISYADGFDYDEIPVHTILTDPEGQKNILRKRVRIRNAAGAYQGTPYGDVWTVDKVVYEHKQLKNKGKYSFTLQQMTSHYELPGVLSVGCKVVPSKKQK